ncbi:hypothetical protein TX23_04410 [Pseudomonas paralactis]|jgi:hypothetical protein|uniref:Uncharacterized protein n=1 Tax=Pseudomonas paralactis TaxID=1615673 RepID=A0A0R3AKJ3_9PSED|nr:hypothetical protein TX23_04410 [Pseudomonas paralactis]
MFEFIGIVVVLIFGWAALKVIVSRIFPEYGLRRAERRYMKEPSSENERLMWDARHRLNRRKRG